MTPENESEIKELIREALRDYVEKEGLREIIEQEYLRLRNEEKNLWKASEKPY